MLLNQPNNRRSIVRIVSTIILLVLTCLGQAQNIQNSGFETPSTGQADWLSFSAGDNIGGWQLVAGTAEILRGSAFGFSSQVLDMNGVSPAVLRQTIQTSANTTYQLSFSWYNWAASRSSKHLIVRWNGTVLGSVIYSQGGASSGTVTFEVKGTGSDTIQFESQNGGNEGIFIDNVSLSPLAQELLRNGNFESPNTAGADWLFYSAGDNISGWELVSGTAEILRGSAFGFSSQVLDMNGVSPATIRQTLGTTSEGNYELSFNWFNWSASQTRKELAVMWNGSTVGTVIYNPGSSPSSGSLQYFVRANGSDVLQFQSRSSGNEGIFIDNVSLNLLSTGPDQPPTISQIADQTVYRSQATLPLSFQISDHETASDALDIRVRSSNETLVPKSNIHLVGAGSSRTIVVVPTAKLLGTSTIAIEVLDRFGQMASESFQVTVVPSPGEPSISDISDQRVFYNGAIAAIAFTVSDLQTAAEQLNVTVASSNQRLIPDSNIQVGGTGADRTLTIAPSKGQIGVAEITVTVKDQDGLTKEDTFLVSVEYRGTSPQISNIPNLEVFRRDGQAFVSFTVGDQEDSPGSLQVQARSSNETFLPRENLTISGDGAVRTLRIVLPVRPGIYGITISVSDTDSRTTEERFALDVLSPPTISNIPDQATLVNQPISNLPFQVSDLETSSEHLYLMGESSNQALLPDDNIVFAGGGQNRTVTLIPVAGKSGQAVVTVYVVDGLWEYAYDEFTLTVTVPGSKLSQTITFPAIPDRLLSDGPILLSASASSGLPVALSIVSGPATINANQIVPTGTGVVVVAASQPGNESYDSAVTIERSFTVRNAGSKLDQSIVFNPLPDRMLASSPIRLIASSTSGLPVQFNIISGPAELSGDLLTIIGAGTITVRASQVGNGDYNAAVSIDRTFTVSKSDQSIQFTALSDKVIGDPSFTIQASASSGLPVTFSIVSGPATMTGNTVSLNGTGTVTIRADQSGNDIYMAAPSVDRTFTILDSSSKSQQTISFLPIGDKILGEVPFSLEATSISGLPVTYSVILGGATINGGMVSLTSTGSVTIRASQNGNNAYHPAPDVQQSFTVKENLLPDISKIEDRVLIPGGTLSAAFVIADSDHKSGPFLLEVRSDNPSILEDTNLVFVGEGSRWTLQSKGALDRLGETRIHITAKDPAGGTAKQAFLMKVVNAPKLTPLADILIDEDQVSALTEFEFVERSLLSEKFVINAVSSNPTLIPNENILYAGSGFDRGFVVYPAPDQFGEAVLTLMVQDGEIATSMDVKVRVNSINDLPFIGEIADQISGEGQLHSIKVLLTDKETPVHQLVLKAVSTNPDLLLARNVTVTNEGNESVLNVQPNPGRSGSTTIIVTVTDSEGGASSRSFSLTVLPRINQPPSVFLSQPASQSVFFAPATITLSAIPEDADGGVVRVEFYNGSEKLGERFAPPFELQWTNVPIGNYLITARVFDNEGALTSSMPVSVEVKQPPVANDHFRNRITIQQSSPSVTGSSHEATRETGEPSHGIGGGKSVWWSWNSLLDARVTVSTKGSNFDTVLGVYTGDSVDKLQLIASNDDDSAGGVTSRLTFEARAGNSYAFAIDGVGNQSGTIHLTVSVDQVLTEPLKIQPSGKNIVLTWPTNLVDSMIIESTDDLLKGSWTLVEPPSTTDGDEYFLKIITSDPRKFYRIRIR